MKLRYRIEAREGDWFVPMYKTFWGWTQLSGGRIKYEDALLVIARHATTGKGDS